MARTDELFAAIQAKDAARVRAILGSDPSIASARDDEGVSALLRARYTLSRDVVEAVRSHVQGLDVFEAAAFGDVDRLAEVLAARPAVAGDRSGADPGAVGTGWMTGTALHSAVSARHPNVVAALLDRGADPNARQAGGWTPLHGAAHNGDVETTELLLAHGADATAADDEGRTVEDRANERGDPGTIAAIRRAIG